MALAASGAVHGRSGTVTAAGSDLASVTAFSYEETVDETETTARGDDAKSFLGGLPDGSGQVDCWWDESSAGHDALITGLQNGTTVAVVLYPQGTAADNAKYSGNVVVKSMSMSSSKDDIVTISFQFRGFLTKAVTV